MRLNKNPYGFILEHKNFLTKQQLKTLLGQVKAGNNDGAQKGLAKILDRVKGDRCEK